MSDHSSDLHELPDLAGDVRDRVVIPPYAEVSRRVRARRLRGAVGAMAAAVVVVTGVALSQTVATTAGPSTPQPAGTSQGPIQPTDETQWRAVVDGTDSHPFEIQGTDDGSIAVVWRALEPGAPTFALVIREADGSVHGMRLDEPVSLTPVPGGWVGMDGSRGHLIGSDGSWTDLDETASRWPQPGDVVVTGQYSSWLYSPVDQGLVADARPRWRRRRRLRHRDGDLVTCGPRPGSVAGLWTTRPAWPRSARCHMRHRRRPRRSFVARRSATTPTATSRWRACSGHAVALPDVDRPAASVAMSSRQRVGRALRTPAGRSSSPDGILADRTAKPGDGVRRGPDRLYVASLRLRAR